MFNFEYVDDDMLEKTKLATNMEYLTDAQLGIQEIPMGYMLPFNSGRGGVLTGDLKYIDESFIHCTAGKSYPFDVNQVEYVDKTVVYIGLFHSIWGHCITDNLKHLWFMLDNKYNYLQDYDFVYLTHSNDPTNLPENLCKILNKIGITRDKIITVKTVTQFKSIILPDQCFKLNSIMKQRQYTKEYIALIDKICEGIEPAKEDKIYFTRSALKNKRDYGDGEKKIETLLERIGYKIYSPEKLTLEDQIALLKGCSVFVATDGSISHNAVFLREAATLVILRKAKYQNGYQAAINKIRNFNVVYIDTHKSIVNDKEQPWNGPFFLYPNKKFCTYFDIQYPGFPYISFFSYVIHPIWIKLVSLIKRAIKKVLKILGLYKLYVVLRNKIRRY